MSSFGAGGCKRVETADDAFSSSFGEDGGGSNGPVIKVIID